MAKKLVKLVWFLVLNEKKKIGGTPILKLAMVKRLEVRKFVKNLSKKLVKRFVKKIIFSWRDANASSVS